MKILSFSRFFLLATMSCSLLFLISCNKEVSNEAEQFDSEFGKFTKEIVLSDALGENTAVLLIGSDDESVLEMWGPENYPIYPILEGQTLAEAMEGVDSQEEYPEITDEDELDGADNGPAANEVSTRFISKNLKPGVRNIALGLIGTDDDLRGWSYQTHYSGTGSENTATFYGHNGWHRGFYGLKYKAYSSSGWGVIVGEWKKIKKNQVHPYDKNPCHQMRARRKYKGSNQSVTVEFEY